MALTLGCARCHDHKFDPIPTADYYTSDGYRIEQNGVKPDIETKSEEALNKVLSELISD